MKRTYEISKKILILTSISLIAAAMIVPTIAGYDEPKVQAEQAVKKGLVQTIMIVGIDEIAFVPNIATINVGDTIVFINQDGYAGGFAHSIIAVDGYGNPTGQFESPLIQVGETFKITFTEPGIYQYIDSIYPGEQGIIAVR
ncbi:Hypothetical protein Nlim_1289 [Candidatus Nitrosarchaeum limnium SFB1]|jgi:plastocyanin|uniref:Blue (type 1) copper domain-containing protein n=1 Tax=Candidatus Nitrosarchaeum limnium SFB1 TaxID=886738 RepID=F3KLA9_9ARCH|nr:Hypothetical protein Nlim_1289 [Candidatus Nitrosarchaeum limnium SFB1]